MGQRGMVEAFGGESDAGTTQREVYNHQIQRKASARNCELAEVLSGLAGIRLDAGRVGGGDSFASGREDYAARLVLVRPDQYVVLDDETPLALLDQKMAGKKLLLITNSEWAYTVAMMRFAMDPLLSALRPPVCRAVGARRVRGVLEF